MEKAPDSEKNKGVKGKDNVYQKVCYEIFKKSNK